MYVVSGPSRPSSFSCETIEKRPAHGPMPTWTLIGAPTSRASSQSWRTTSGLQKPGPARSHRERHQPVVAREVAVADAADVLGRVQLALEPPRVERRVRVAVAVDGAEARVAEAADRLVGVLRRVVDVRPVEERRDAGVDRLERAEVVPGVDVLRPVRGRELVEHEVEVAAEADVGRDPADHGLPRVPVRVDEAGDDDAAGRVDDLGVAGLERVADGRDPVVLDEDVAAVEVAELRSPWSAHDHRGAARASARRSSLRPDDSSTRASSEYELRVSRFLPPCRNRSKGIRRFRHVRPGRGTSRS